MEIGVAMQLGALRNALIEAGTSHPAAGKASEEVASYDTRIATIETRLAVLTWMSGASIGLTLLILGNVIGLWTKLGDISGQLTQIARAIH